jgi:hypothetical protein
MEDPTKSGLEVTVKPGMDKTVDIVVKGVGEFKNPAPKPGLDITKGGKGFGGGKGKDGDKDSKPAESEGKDGPAKTPETNK